MTMNEDRVRILLTKLNKLLAKLAEETDLAIAVDTTKYSDNNAVITIEAAERSPDGVIMGRDAEAFLDRAVEFALQPTDLGLEFKHFDKRYRIVGMKPRSRAPVLCERIDPPAKALTKFPAHIVRHYLECQQARSKASHRSGLKVVDGGDGKSTTAD